MHARGKFASFGFFNYNSINTMIMTLCEIPRVLIKYPIFSKKFRGNQISLRVGSQEVELEAF